MGDAEEEKTAEGLGDDGEAAAAKEEAGGGGGGADEMTAREMPAPARRSSAASTAGQVEAGKRRMRACLVWAAVHLLVWLAFGIFCLLILKDPPYQPK